MRTRTSKALDDEIQRLIVEKDRNLQTSRIQLRELNKERDASLIELKAQKIVDSLGHDEKLALKKTLEK